MLLVLFGSAYRFITTASLGQKVFLPQKALSLLTASKLPIPTTPDTQNSQGRLLIGLSQGPMPDVPGVVLTLVSPVTLDNLLNVPEHQFPRLSSRAIIVPSSEVSVGMKRDTACKVLKTIPDAG